MEKTYKVNSIISVNNNVEEIAELNDAVENLQEVTANNTSEINKRIRSPETPAVLDTIPVIQKNTTDAFKYVAISNGVSNDIIVKRDNTYGNINLPTVDKIPDEGDVAVSVNKVNSLVDVALSAAQSNILNIVTEATIEGNELSSGETRNNIIRQGEYGAYFAKGDDLIIRYTTQIGDVSISGQMHFIWIYKQPDFDRIVHYAYTNSGGGIFNTPSFTPHDYELRSGITIEATRAGVRVIKMPMKSV